MSLKVSSLQVSQLATKNKNYNDETYNNLSEKFTDNLLRIGIIIPCYNDSQLLVSFLPTLTKTLIANSRLIFERNFESQPIVWDIIIVDDGSSTNPLEEDKLSQVFLKKESPKSEVELNLHVLKHPINLGQGASLGTGIEFALRNLSCKFFVTMDADGQHDPSDLNRLVKPIVKGDADIVFGNRFGGELSKNMPKGRKTLLTMAKIFEKIITGLNLSDAHNGYRAFNANTAKSMKIEQNRMAHATEIKQLVARAKLKYTEAPVSIVYTEETNAGGQSNIGSLVILKDLLKSYLFNS